MLWAVVVEIPVFKQLDNLAVASVAGIGDGVSSPTIRFGTYSVVEQELDYLLVALGGCQVHRCSTVIIASLEVELLCI
jgi:hypothetical protein